MASPLAASKMLPMMDCGELGGEDDGSFLGFDLARAEALQSAACGFAADLFGVFEFGDGACVREPIVALHVALFVVGDGRCGEAAVAAAVLADEAAGVHHDLVRGCGVEVAAAGVLDAGVVGKGRGFGAAGDLDALGGGHLVDVVEVEVLIFFDLAELVRFGKPGEGIFAGDLRERDGAFDQAGDALGRKSEDEVLAVCCPMKTRRPTAREPDSFRVSTWPRWTSAENSSPS